jgi:hypothetical protein
MILPTERNEVPIGTKGEGEGGKEREAGREREVGR